MRRTNFSIMNKIFHSIQPAPGLWASISARRCWRAARGRPSATAEIELRQMDVTRMDLPDGHFDAPVATFLFCALPDELQVPALRELSRVAKGGSIIRLLEYTRPRGAIRRALTKVWEPWVHWAYGASFDRRTEQHGPEAGLHLPQSRFVVDDLIKIIEARRPE
jgi:ubiquinone/menaquinone biosynthesis C-methylase UbiE